MQNLSLVRPHHRWERKKNARTTRTLYAEHMQGDEWRIIISILSGNRCENLARATRTCLAIKEITCRASRTFAQVSRSFLIFRIGIYYQSFPRAFPFPPPVFCKRNSEHPTLFHSPISFVKKYPRSAFRFSSLRELKRKIHFYATSKIRHYAVSHGMFCDHQKFNLVFKYYIASLWFFTCFDCAIVIFANEIPAIVKNGYYK